MNKKSGRVVVTNVKQLGGTIVTANDEQCFLVMLKLKDFQ